MDLFTRVSVLFVVLCLSFFGVNGQSQLWNTKYAKKQDQDDGADKQHWASGKAGNGGQQFMSMSSLYEKVESLFEIDDLFINKASDIKSSFPPITPAAKPDATKEANIDKALKEVDKTLHQNWAKTVIDSVFGGKADLGLGAEFPVILPMLVPVRFISDKDIDVNIEQIYSPPPTKESSKNDGGSAAHQNTEKIHIHLGPKASTIPAGKVKLDQNALYAGDDGVLFTGKLKLKRKTLCKILCLRGTGNVPACCTCSAYRKRDVRDIEEEERQMREEKQKRRKKEELERLAESNKCSFFDSSYLSGSDVTTSDCIYCKCFDGQISCFVRKTCISLEKEHQQLESEMEVVRNFILEKGSNSAVMENFQTLRSELVEVQKLTKKAHNAIVEELDKLYEEVSQATQDFKITFLARYQEQDTKAKSLNIRRNDMLKKIIKKIKKLM